MYCKNCGSKLEENAFFCTNCGARVDEHVTSTSVTTVTNNMSVEKPKSKIVAAILAIFLGNFGVHNFYLGYTGKAIAQLLLTLVGWIVIVGPIVASIWSFVEGIILLVTDDKTDAKGNKLSNN